MGFWYERDLKQQKKELEKGQRARERKVFKLNELLTTARQGCSACPLDKEPLQHGKMKPTGSANPLAYILGEAPGREEDEHGEQFVGKGGKLLRAEIPKRYLDHIRWNNTLRCRPPGNRDPDPLELACCRVLQERDIEKTAPRAILGFGAVPLNWVTNKSLTITPWRGRRLPVQVGGHVCWYYPIMHPAFIGRVREQAGKGEEQWRLFRSDIKRALHEVFEGELPEPTVEPKNARLQDVQCLTHPTYAELRRVLEEASGWQELGLDYETNALRPYFPERKVLSIAISNYNRTIAFPYAHPEHDWGTQAPKVKKLVQEFLLRSGRKWVHNLAFEQEWTAEEWGMDLLRGAAWGDTMAQAYLLDEREGAKALGDLTLLHFGFDVKAESAVDGGKLELEPLSKVLPYNGMDAKYCYALSQVQRELLEQEALSKVYEEQVRRIPTLVLAQRAGLEPNAEEIEQLESEHQQIEDRALNRILEHRDIKAWIKNGNKFLPSSPKDWKAFLQYKFKGKGIDDAQEETLAALNYEPAKLEIERRHAHKLVSTYFTPYKPPGGSAVHADGKIHTQYNANKTTTRRLSSEDPNVQNVEVRRYPKARAIIKAPKGYKMLKVDYGQLEARVIAMASKDKVLVQQTWNNYDIHSDWTVRMAEDLALQAVLDNPTKQHRAYKEWRDTIKNGWTFPLFFGSSAISVAKNLVPEPGKTWQHDSRKGRDTPLPWLLDRVDEFWGQYKGVRRWQNSMKEFYDEHGYVQTLTGFRRRAPLSWNELINQPIQGTASDIVIDRMNHMSEIAEAERLPALQPVLNVHDELDFYLPSSEVDAYVPVIAELMSCCDMPFINVPLSVEVSVGDNWYAQEEIGVFSTVDFREGGKEGYTV